MSRFDPPGFQILFGEGLYLLLRHEVIASEVLRDVQCRTQSGAFFIGQRRMELLVEVRHPLALLIQQEAQVIPIVDEIRQFMVFTHQILHFREDAAGIQ